MSRRRKIRRCLVAKSSVTFSLFFKKRQIVEEKVSRKDLLNMSTQGYLTPKDYSLTCIGLSSIARTDLSTFLVRIQKSIKVLKTYKQVIQRKQKIKFISIIIVIRIIYCRNSKQAKDKNTLSEYHISMDKSSRQCPT
jgi:hypothetical protein